jgi:beta-galactosidase
LLPHWNWPGKEGQAIEVWVHGNCEEVELFLNGTSQGRKAIKRNSHLEWKVKYAPGTLLARGFSGGKEVLTDKVETTGAPATIQLTPHRGTLKADGEDVAVITVQANDAQGRMVPTASNTITFELAGPGKLIGVGNGDPSSHEPDQFVEGVNGPGNQGGTNPGSPESARATTTPGAWKRSLFSGLAQVILQSTGEPGEITLTARSPGVTDGVLKIPASKAPLRPAIR